MTKASGLSMKKDKDVSLFKEAFVMQWRDLFSSVPLQKGSKRASVGYKKTHGFDLDLIRESENYGLIPRKSVLILDIDVHDDDGASIDKRVDFFSKVLRVNLHKTFAVKSPSGGLHIYLKMPMDYDQFSSSHFSLFQGRIAGGKRNEEKTRKKFGFAFDTDLRTPGSLGYVVGPGSSLNMNEHYEIMAGRQGFMDYDLDSIPVATLSVEGLKNFKKICIDPFDSGRSKSSDLVDVDQQIEFDEELLKTDLKKVSLPDDRSLMLITDDFKRKAEGISSFHRKRSILFGIMNCCYDEATMAKVAIELSINRDTYSESYVRGGELIKDFARMRLKFGESTIHSKSCGNRKGGVSTFDPSMMESREDSDLYTRKRSLQQIARMRKSEFHTGPFEARVLDTPKIFKKLLESSRHGKVTQRIRYAMSIVDGYFQPLSNVGAVNIIVHRGTLSKALGLSETQVSEGMRLLRDEKVVNIFSKQKTGMAPVYRLSDGFTHKQLTFHLRKTWGATGVESKIDGSVSHAPVFFSSVDRGFIDLTTYEYRYGGITIDAYLDAFAKVDEECGVTEPSVDLLQRYSRKMIEKRVEHIERVKSEEALLEPKRSDQVSYGVQDHGRMDSFIDLSYSRADFDFYDFNGRSPPRILDSS